MNEINGAQNTSMYGKSMPGSFNRGYQPRIDDNFLNQSQDNGFRQGSSNQGFGGLGEMGRTYQGGGMAQTSPVYGGGGYQQPFGRTQASPSWQQHNQGY